MSINTPTDKKRLQIILLMAACGLYILAGIPFNPFILWTAFPLYMGYSMIKRAWRTESLQILRQGYGFLIVSIGWSYFYHLAWFFDWDGIKTSSSTSALIFIGFPIYAIVFGYMGYFIVWLYYRLLHWVNR